MLKKLILVIFILANIINSFSQFDVTIKGYFPGSKGKNIRLFEYDDLITFRQKNISQFLIDENEKFEFELLIYEPQYVFFRIDHATVGLHIEPGKQYNIEFQPVNFDELDIRRNPYLDPLFFPFEILSSDENELNIIIDSLETLIDEFLLDNISLTNRRRLGHILNDFKSSMDSLFASIDNQYFNDYYEYLFGKYFRMLNAKTDYDIGAEYFFNREVLYKNLQYMDLFNNYFENFIFSGSRHLRVQDIEFTVNELGSYTALMDSLGKDTLLRNEVLRELVLLKSLENIYNHNDFSQKNIDQILNFVYINSKFPVHRRIAENILWSNNHLKFGSKAPDFKLTDTEGKVYNLNDFKGKFLYLSFFTSWCIPCIAEFPVKEDLYAQYGDFMEFVSVSADRHLTQYSQFIRNNDYSWKFFHFDENFEILDDYHVRSYPVFVLISPEGNIVNFPARYPSVVVQGYFDYLKRIHIEPERDARQRLFQDINR